MNIAVIFAGGTGRRMNSRSKPKQFLEVHGKPILVYTMEAFEKHPDIDGIFLVVLKEWTAVCEELIARFGLTKVKAVVPGGKSALDSQHKGLLKATETYGGDTVVLIHDGVRPLIDPETIERNIAAVKEHGAAVTVTPAIETITLKSETGEIKEIIDRSKVEMARAPQSFYLGDILEAHRRAEEDGKDFIDSASMMWHYGHALYAVEGLPENIKITTPSDFYTFRAFIDARENAQIYWL